MKTIAIAVGLALAASAATALAETDRNFPYDPDAVAQQQWREAWEREHNDRWNEERLREDRYYHDYRAAPAYGYGNAYAYGRDASWECWNPRARHFENVREGERQDDLDFGRCRIAGTGGVQPYPGYRGYGYRWR